MSDPTDLRLWAANQKLKGFTKLITDADNNLKIVRDNRAADIATAMRKMREPIRRELASSRPHPHLTLVK